MNRKWLVLPVTMGAVALLAANLTIAADDEETPTKKVMEKVQKANLQITKAVRTPVAFKKAQKDVSGYAEEIVKLAKEARTHKGPSEKQKQPYEKWTALMDDLIATTEQFAKDSGKPDASQTQVKSAYRGVSKKCSSCHEVFRVDEDEFK
jgi:cytochrome c556